MEPIKVSDLLEWTGGTLIAGSADGIIKNVVIDSREATEGSCFFALPGENADGHDFLSMAADNGASCLVVKNEERAKGLGACVVKAGDVMEALQAAASGYLDMIDIGRAAVTGSVGKTSTRDMIYYMLQSRFKTGRPVKNYNSDAGVPLTVFSFDSSYDMAVFELGMDRMGEIHRLARITRPKAAAITNIGISHLENLGSRENILKAKMEITDYFDDGSVLVVNSDSDYLDSELSGGAYKVLTCGTKGGEDLHITSIEDRGDRGTGFDFVLEGKSYHAELPVPGAHNALNCSLALLVAREMGVGIDEGIDAVRNLELTGKRLVIEEKGGFKVIDDSYNAAPDSMKSAVRTLMNTEGGRKVAVLGDMNELGEGSEDHHRDVGAYAIEEGVDLLIAVGKKAEDICEGGREKDPSDSRVRRFETKEDLFKEMDIFRPGDVILVKASNSLRFNEIADKILGR